MGWVVEFCLWGEQVCFSKQHNKRQRNRLQDRHPPHSQMLLVLQYQQLPLQHSQWEGGNWLVCLPGCKVEGSCL